MFFKNLKLYRLTQDLPFDAEALEIALATKPARACASQELTTYGFIAPFGKGENAPLVHVSGDFLLVGARKEERILPGSVVRDALKEKVDAIEADQMRKVYKAERDRLKDEIIQAFLPRAFVRQACTYAAIAPKLGLIIVNSYSARTAEDLLSTLREVIGSLPVRPVTSKIAPSASLTDWVKTQRAPAGFTVLDECELRDTHEDGGTVRCKRQDLTADEFQMHLNSGKVVTQLSLAYQDKLTIVVDADLNLRRLRFSDLLEDQAQQDGGEEALGQLDASFMLMMLTLGEFIPELMAALGGEESFETVSGVPPAPVMRAAPTPAPAPADDGDDELLPQVTAFVRQSQRASISVVQRKFQIGYNRAARLIEALEQAGVVTAMNSRGAREVVQ